MWDSKKSPIKIKFFVTTLLILSGISWGILGASGYNVISRASRLTGIPYLSRIIYLLFGIAALLYLKEYFNRTTFLPFLGQSILPPNLLSIGHPIRFDREITLTAPEDAKYILFWASQAKNRIDENGVASSPESAYGDLSNSGAVAVENGKGVIKIMEPESYQVRGKVLKPHVHYRWLDQTGILSEVEKLDL